MSVVERSVAAAQARCAGNRALDVGACPVDSALDIEPLGEPGGNRRREGAAGAVGVPGRNPRAFPNSNTGGCNEDI